VQNDGVNAVDVLGLKKKKYYIIKCDEATEAGQKAALDAMKKLRSKIDFHKLDTDSLSEALIESLLNIDKVKKFEMFVSAVAKCETAGTKACKKKAKQIIIKRKKAFKKKHPYCKVPQLRCPKNTCNGLLLKTAKNKLRKLFN
jgi:hypothetical protein